LGFKCGCRYRDGSPRNAQRSDEHLGGLDTRINNAEGVQAGRLQRTSDAELRAIIEVDVIAPVLLTRAAITARRESGEAMIVISSPVAALVGMPFYATYEGAKARRARFGGASTQIEGQRCA